LLEDVTEPYPSHNLPPAATRTLFAERGWETVGAFQTRNVPHAGHEYMQKVMLSLVDGLMIQPVIGKKKPGDFTDAMIIQCYDAIIENYFVRERVLLNILPTEMRYAGPREAIFHAIVRKNYGCTHMVVGRDHAGVGNYYHPEAAINIFNDFKDIELQPVCIRGDFFHCHVCQSLGSERTCAHDPSHHISFSGTEIRAMLKEGRRPPEEIMRPEVFDILAASDGPFVV
jgi:sulfate adenylyltransferase